MLRYWHDMRTYNELTAKQKETAFNYHLNSLIPPLALLEQSPESEPWSSLDKQVAALTPQALANAQTATYGNDPVTGILPVKIEALNLALASC